MEITHIPPILLKVNHANSEMNVRLCSECFSIVPYWKASIRESTVVSTYLPRLLFLDVWGLPKGEVAIFQASDLACIHYVGLRCDPSY